MPNLHTFAHEPEEEFWDDDADDYIDDLGYSNPDIFLCTDPACTDPACDGVDCLGDNHSTPKE